MNSPLFNIRTLTSQTPGAFTKACALLLAVTVILLAVLAVCPAAHEWFHHDADHSDHECAVTLFAHGVTTAITGVALALISWRLIGNAIASAKEFQLPPLPSRFPPGRAPPVG